MPSAYDQFSEMINKSLGSLGIPAKLPSQDKIVKAVAQPKPQLPGVQINVKAPAQQAQPVPLKKVSFLNFKDPGVSKELRPIPPVQPKPFRLTVPLPGMAEKKMAGQLTNIITGSIPKVEKFFRPVTQSTAEVIKNVPSVVLGALKKGRDALKKGTNLYNKYRPSTLVTRAIDENIPKTDKYVWAFQDAKKDIFRYGGELSGRVRNVINDLIDEKVQPIKLTDGKYVNPFVDGGFDVVGATKDVGVFLDELDNGALPIVRDALKSLNDATLGGLSQGLFSAGEGKIVKPVANVVFAVANMVLPEFRTFMLASGTPYGKIAYGIPIEIISDILHKVDEMIGGNKVEPAMRALGVPEGVISEYKDLKEEAINLTAAISWLKATHKGESALSKYITSTTGYRIPLAYKGDMRIWIEDTKGLLERNPGKDPAKLLEDNGFIERTIVPREYVDKIYEMAGKVGQNLVEGFNEIRSNKKGGGEPFSFYNDISPERKIDILKTGKANPRREFVDIANDWDRAVNELRPTEEIAKIEKEMRDSYPTEAEGLLNGGRISTPAVESKPEVQKPETSKVEKPVLKTVQDFERRFREIDRSPIPTYEKIAEREAARAQDTSENKSISTIAYERSRKLPEVETGPLEFRGPEKTKTQLRKEAAALKASRKAEEDMRENASIFKKTKDMEPTDAELKAEEAAMQKESAKIARRANRNVIENTEPFTVAEQRVPKEVFAMQAKLERAAQAVEPRLRADSPEQAKLEQFNALILKLSSEAPKVKKLPEVAVKAKVSEIAQRSQVAESQQPGITAQRFGPRGEGVETAQVERPLTPRERKLSEAGDAERKGRLTPVKLPGTSGGKERWVLVERGTQRVAFGPASRQKAVKAMSRLYKEGIKAPAPVVPQEKAEPARGVTESRRLEKVGDIMNTKRDIALKGVVVDGVAQDSVIPKGEPLTSYKFGGRYALRDGHTWIVNSRQFQNIKNQSSHPVQAKPFAPEFSSLEESLYLGENTLYTGKAENAEQSLVHGGEPFELLLKYPSKHSPEKIRAYLESMRTMGDLDTQKADALLSKKFPGSIIETHWGEDLVIASIRGNSIVVGGKRYLFIEEIQSQMYSKLREMGGKALEDALRKYPLLGKWREVAIKRILQDATEGPGYDGVAFANPDQIKARNKLSGQVTSVSWKPEGLGKEITLMGENAEGVMDILSVFQARQNGRIASADTSIDGRKLLDVVGEQRIVDGIMGSPEGELAPSGELRFGGEWVDELYGKMLASDIRGLTGKEMVNLDLSEGAPSLKSQPTLPITPDVKAIVEGRPVPMRQPSGILPTVSDIDAQKAEPANLLSVSDIGQQSAQPVPPAVKARAKATKARKAKAVEADNRAEDVLENDVTTKMRVSKPTVEKAVVDDTKAAVEAVASSFGGGMPPFDNRPMNVLERPGEEKGWGSVKRVKDEIAADMSNAQNLIMWFSNLGKRDLEIIGDPKMMHWITQFRGDTLEAGNQAQFKLNELMGDASLESQLTALRDLQFRSLLRDIKNELPVNRPMADILADKARNDQILTNDPKAQEMVARYEKIRKEMLDLYREAGKEVSDEMYNDPDYFPKDIFDSFEDMARPSRRGGLAPNAPAMQRKEGSGRPTNPNLPQTVMEFYDNMYKSLPAIRLIRDIKAEFALKDADEKPYHPKGPGDLPKGYVNWQPNSLNLFPMEIVDRMSGAEKQVIAAASGETYAIPKTMADWLARYERERSDRNSAMMKATGVWKGFAIMSNPFKYLMRNMYSDGIGGLAYSKNPIRYIKYYSEAWGDMMSYYLGGVVTPTMRNAIDRGMLEMGFASEGFRNPILNSPINARIRHETFGETSMSKHILKSWNDLVRMQEAAGRIALARDLGDGIISIESAAEANDLMVDFRNMKNARKGLEVVSPFLQWSTGTIQSLVRTMTMQDGKYMKWTPQERAWKAARVWGVLGAATLLFNNFINHQGQTDQSKEDALQASWEKTPRELTPYEISNILDTLRGLGGFVPNNYTIAMWDGKPVMTSGGGVLLITIDNPMSAMDLITDPIRASQNGTFSQWAKGKLNPLAMGLMEILNNQRLAGGEVYNPTGSTLAKVGDIAKFSAGKIIPITNTVMQLMKKIEQGQMIATDMDKLKLALQYTGVPSMWFDLAKARVKLQELKAKQGVPEAEAIQDRGWERVKEIDRGFSPLIKNYAATVVKQKWNAPGELMPFLRNSDPAQIESAKKAYSYLLTQRPEDQAELVKGLMLSLRPQMSLVYNGKSPQVIFNTLKFQYDRAKADMAKSPLAFRTARQNLIGFVDSWKESNVNAITFNSPETAQNVLDLKAEFARTPMTREELARAKAEADYSKFVNLTGLSEYEIYQNVANFGRMLFGNEYVDNIATKASPTPAAQPQAQPQQRPLPGVQPPQRPQLPTAQSYGAVAQGNAKRAKPVRLKPVSLFGKNSATPYRY